MTTWIFRAVRKSNLISAEQIFGTLKIGREEVLTAKFSSAFTIFIKPQYIHLPFIFHVDITASLSVQQSL